MQSTTERTKANSTRISTGVPGLDEVTRGGLTPHRLYLVQGPPGAGKTTLSLQFLIEGRKNGEKVIYFTLAESQAELEATAEAHGWSLEGIDIVEVALSKDMQVSTENYTMYHPSEVELSETTRTILDVVAEKRPSRVIIDSLSELRVLAQNPVTYRRQILAIKQFFVGKSCSVILLDDVGREIPEMAVESIAHGVIRLDQSAPLFGASRRRIQILKMRGAPFKGGFHDFSILTGGLKIYPRIVAAEHHGGFEEEQFKSGLPEIDALLGGGLDRGTATLVMGPAGTGKSTLTMQYALEAAKRGKKSTFFIFDESGRTLRKRMKGLGMGIDAYVDNGLITIRQVDPAELSPGEFGDKVKTAVAQDHCSIIVIDSLNGYMNAMPDESFLNTQLHELCTYLGQEGVLTFLVVAQAGLIGPNMTSPVDLSYLADSVLLMRFFERRGAVKQALSVLKKRSGKHERTIREIWFTDKGLAVGEPLTQFQGVLTGVPEEINANLGR